MTNDFADYKQIDAVNASSLKVLWQKSPKHYLYSLDHPRAETDGMRFGTAVHCAVLEPDKFAAQYVVKPLDMSFVTKEGKAWRQEQYDAGMLILSNDDYEAIQGIVASIMAHPVARRMMTGGTVEQTLNWTDPETGIRCKGRTDIILDDGTLCDLKTCRDIREKQFTRQILDLGYHLSMAFYIDGLTTMNRTPPRTCFVCVETSAPYDVAVYEFNADWLELGRDEYRPALQTLAQCRLTGVYPGIAPEAVDLELPAWAYPKIVADDSSGFEIVEEDDE